MESNPNYDNSQEALNAAILKSSLRAKEVYDSLTEEEIVFIDRYAESNLLRKYMTASDKLMIKALLVKGAVTKEKFYQHGNEDNNRVCYQSLSGLHTYMDYLDGVEYKHLIEIFGKIN